MFLPNSFYHIWQREFVWLVLGLVGQPALLSLDLPSPGPPCLGPEHGLQQASREEVFLERAFPPLPLTL